MTLFPQYLYIENALTADDLKQIEQISNTGKPVSGHTTLNGGNEDTSARNQLKRNTEIELDPANYDLLAKTINDRMFSNKSYVDYTVPQRTRFPLLSRMVVGDYYHPHQDNHLAGDFSTTYFLSDPETYEGGELCLWFNNEEHKFKPSAGSSVTYRTGIPHRVNPVTKGVRNVAIQWCRSEIKDPFAMEIHYGLRLLAKQFPDVVCDNLEEAMSDPMFITANLIEMILRRQDGA